MCYAVNGESKETQRRSTSEINGISIEMNEEKKPNDTKHRTTIKHQHWKIHFFHWKIIKRKDMVKCDRIDVCNEADAKPMAFDVCNNRKDAHRKWTRAQCNQIEYCANSHKKNIHTHSMDGWAKNRPCEEDTEVKIPKNEIKSIKCEW